MTNNGSTTKRQQIEMALGKALTHSKNALAVVLRLLSTRTASTATAGTQEESASPECDKARS